MAFEEPISLTELFQKVTNKTDTSKEYGELRNLIEHYDNDALCQVENIRKIDMSYVITPFQEVNPKAKNDGGVHPFGLIIASDAHHMNVNGGPEEFWTTILAENVHYITAFNEEFTKNRDDWCGVYQYFPDEEQKEIEVGQKYVIKNLTEKVVKTDNYTRRFLEVLAPNGTLLRSLQHIHFHVWDDFSVPEKQANKDMI